MSKSTENKIETPENQIETKTVRQLKNQLFNGDNATIAANMFMPMNDKDGTSEAVVRNINKREAARLASGDWVLLSKQTVVIKDSTETFTWYGAGTGNLEDGSYNEFITSPKLEKVMSHVARVQKTASFVNATVVEKTFSLADVKQIDFIEGKQK